MDVFLCFTLITLHSSINLPEGRAFSPYVTSPHVTGVNLWSLSRMDMADEDIDAEDRPFILLTLVRQ